jgi:hypothetical protein
MLASSVYNFSIYGLSFNAKSKFLQELKSTQDSVDPSERRRNRPNTAMPSDNNSWSLESVGPPVPFELLK